MGFKLNQEKAPIKEGLEEFLLRRIVPFDVPGHKRGRSNSELTEFLGKRCMERDVNSMKPLDNLCHPVSIIAEAECLAADAFGAAAAFFMVGGTTSSVQAMIMSATKRGDKLILPRNVHRSVINSLVLNGAVPVYVNPSVDSRLGISLCPSLTDFEKAIVENSDAKAVLLNNPTYYGICPDIKNITKIAHKHGMKVLADEAHGTHFYFSDSLPTSAMAAGADMAAVSMHKSGGSLTQSSFLLVGNAVNENYVRQIINLTQTTSGNYLLLSSLDLARKKLALEGSEIFKKIIELATYARGEINQIGDYYAYSDEIINGETIYDFDITKLAVHTMAVGLAGIEVYELLRDDYDIQLEFGDFGNILAYISVGDRLQDLERLVGALSEIRRRFKKSTIGMFSHEYIDPKVITTPQKAFYSAKKSLPLKEATGKISGEFVMCYPPGIPILAPGELITREITDYITYAREKGCSLTGAQDMKTERLMTVDDS
ncbi:MAG: aminotransferase class I/II-fold pyridoxal phosphate-dependent enzyme [Oscillospiraceae bacterium]|nr:aminotransferase class I/II-fold pyridoxal phosphate-dependent enzyme [Oscillospiraceae bacterium]